MRKSGKGLGAYGEGRQERRVRKGIEDGLGEAVWFSNSKWSRVMGNEVRWDHRVTRKGHGKRRSPASCSRRRGYGTVMLQQEKGRWDCDVAAGEGEMGL